MLLHDLPRLNLPAFDVRWKEAGENTLIWDSIRKKYLVLTPEEWVRQHFIHLLHTHLHYPKAWFKIESGLSYNRTSKRSDILILNRDGSARLLVECKAAEIPLSADVLRQVSIYNHSLQADYVAITNGMKHFVWKFFPDQNTYQPLRDFPVYQR